MKKLSHLLDELDQRAVHFDHLDSGISTATIGWHIQHSFLVIIQIVSRLQSSDPTLYKWKFNLARSYVYLLEKIPRGRGKAPEIVVPKGEINSEEINRHNLLARAAITELVNLDSNSFIKHPYFGELNLKQTETFLVLHTRHHLKIIDDILENKK